MTFRVVVLCSPYQFRTYKQSGRSGAIIVLPHGGSSSCIRNAYFRLPEVKQHFREHAPSWYQHALQYIPKQTNGSLILVRATYCARSWGIAAFASKRDIREPLTATFMPNPTYEYQHMWQTNDSTWKTSTGPSSEELRELAGGEPPLNQCIGVVISSLRLDDTTWQANFGRLSSSSRRGGGWGLHRVMSRDSRSTIHVDNSGKRRLLDFIFRRPTEIRHASYGSDGMFLSDGSPDISSIYINVLPQIIPFCLNGLNGIRFSFHEFWRSIPIPKQSNRIFNSFLLCDVMFHVYVLSVSAFDLQHFSLREPRALLNS